MSEEKSPPPLKQYLQRLEIPRKIGRFVCVALILAICGRIVYSTFRLLDSFDEKEPLQAENTDADEIPLPFPIVAFDPAGKWEIAGLSPGVIAESPPLMQIPESAMLLSVRNDREGNPQMQLYEISEEDISLHSEHWEQNLVDSWTKLGWATQSLGLPGVISYECTKSDEHRFIQFFSDETRYYVLLSRAEQN